MDTPLGRTGRTGAQKRSASRNRRSMSPPGSPERTRVVMSGDSQPLPLFQPGQGRVVALCGAGITSHERLAARGVQLMDPLPTGTVVTVEEVRGRRARISDPVSGWLSVSTVGGDTIVTPDSAAVVPRLRLTQQQNAFADDGDHPSATVSQDPKRVW